MALPLPNSVNQGQGIAGIMQLLELYQRDPEGVLQKAAESGILPPEIPAVADPGLDPPSAGTGVQGGTVLPAGAPAAEGGVDIQGFLTALQGVQAPPPPAQPRFPAQPAAPNTPQIAPQLAAIMQLLQPQQQTLPPELSRLILGR